MASSIAAVSQSREDARPAPALGRAALGAVLVVAGFILLPAFRTVVESIIGGGDVDYPRPSDIAGAEWWGVSGALIFAVIGVGILLTATALPPTRSGLGAFARSLGVAGGAGFLLCGAGARAMYSFIGANMTETRADAAAQAAALWAVNIVNGAFVIFAGCATAGWLMWLGLTGVREGMLGRPAAVTALVGGILIPIGEIGFVILPVQFVFVPVFAVLAISFWRRSRRLRQTAPDA